MDQPRWEIQPGRVMLGLENLCPSSQSKATLVYLVEERRADGAAQQRYVLKCAGPAVTGSEKEKVEEALCREASALTRLQGVPRVAQIVDSSAGPHITYVLIKLVEGQDLRVVLDAEQRLGPDQVLTIATELCKTLTIVHGEDILHLDIKPSNILLNYTDYTTVLIDFNVAALDMASSRNSDRPVFFKGRGTAEYVAPEQLLTDKSARLMYSTDLYALAVTVYELLVGRKLFPGRTRKNYASYPVPRREELRETFDQLFPEVSSQALSTLIEGCLRSDLNQRPIESAEAFQSALLAALAPCIVLGEAPSDV